MDQLEQLVRDTLAAHEPDAVDVDALRSGLATRVARRRRRTGVALIGVIVLLATIAAVQISTEDRIRTATTETTTQTEVEEPTQMVSWRGIELQVPAEWRINDHQCGTPQSDTVLMLDGPVAACAVRQPPGLTVVELLEASSHAGTASIALATEPVVVDGHPANRGSGVPPGSTTEYSVLLVSDIDVLVEIESPDSSLRERILDSVRVVDVDFRGCPARVSALTPAGPPPTPDGTEKLVPGSPSSAVVCRYSGYRLAQSAEVPAARLAELVGILNALPEGMSFPGPGFSEGEDLPETASFCEADRQRGFLLHFRKTAEATLDVYVHIGGCDGLSAANGSRTTKISPELVWFLTELAGYDFHFPDPRELQ